LSTQIKMTFSVMGMKSWTEANKYQ